MNTGHAEMTPFWRSRTGLVLCVFLAVAALFLLLEHRAHVLAFWPLLILLVCGGMHFFMHRGHGQGAHGAHARRNETHAGQGGDHDR